MKTLKEMTAAGAVASVPMSMNEEPIKRAPPKKKPKKQWSNSLREGQVSEADLAEQDLIITHGQGGKVRRGLMPRQSSHEAVEMALSDLLQCRKNARTIEQIIHSTNTSQIEPWVSEKLVKASDYLNTVAEYMEGQRAGQDSGMLTFENKKKEESDDEKTKYSEDTYVICRKNKDGTTSYLTKHAKKEDAEQTLEDMKKNPDCEYSIKKNPNIPGRKTLDEAKKKQRKEKVDEIAPVIGAVAGELLGGALGLGRVGTAVASGVGSLAASSISRKKNKMESKLTRGVNILSELKAAEKENTGYTIVAESYVAELNAKAVKSLLENYRRAINSVSETAVIKAFGDEKKLEMILQQSALITESMPASNWTRAHGANPDVNSRVDPDLLEKRNAALEAYKRATTEEAFEAASKKLGAIDDQIQSECGVRMPNPMNQISEAKDKEKDTEKMARRWGKEMSAMTKEREAGRTNPENLPPEILDRIARNPQDREEIIKGYKEKQAVKEGRKPKRVPKKDKPYAFGMAAAKREAGITTKGKPVPKKVVKKAHKIAKAIKKDDK